MDIFIQVLLFASYGLHGIDAKTEECKKEGGIPELINNKFCNEVNNIQKCNWDGGDCCQTNPKEGWDDDCINCECKFTCELIFEEHIGNKYCDDWLNNKECIFDGGDCCQLYPNEDWDSTCKVRLCISVI